MYILHLQNVPDSADETFIRRYFKDLKISDGGVEIVGSINGDVFLSFDDEADILKGLTYGEKPIHGCRIKILLAEAADREKIIAKALSPPKPIKRKSSRSSYVSESSLPRAASPEPRAFTSDADGQYSESRQPMSPRRDDDPRDGERDWGAELKAKLLHASNLQPKTASEIVYNAGGRDWSGELQEKLAPATREHHPQPASDNVKTSGGRDWSAELQTKLCATREGPSTASDIVKNALLKLNEGQSSDPVEPPYTHPGVDGGQYGMQQGIEEYNTLPPWRGQPGQPPISGPDPTTEMLKNIPQSTKTLPPAGPMSGMMPGPPMLPGPPMPPGLRMPPRPPFGALMMHPYGPPPGHPQNLWRGPPPGPPPFRQRLPGPPRPPLPPMPPSQVAPSPPPLPVSKDAKASGNAQKQSRWGGMAAGSSIQPTVVSSKFLIKSAPVSRLSGTARIAKPLITKGNKAPIFTGKISVNKKQNSTSTANAIDAIVIADSDSDGESEIKQKKRKIDMKSDRDKRVYRFKRSRSRSRSRGRSRSRSRGRDSARSSGPDQSRSRGRGRSKSRERGRSRSRGRKRSRSRSRPRSKQTRGRDRSRSRERGRQQQERPKNTERHLPVHGPPVIPVNLEMFKNDPNSVIVQNVAETVTKMVFRDFFYGHPIVKDGLVLKPSEDIPNSQTGYIKFVHQRDVEQVIKLSYTTLDGKKVVIKSCCGKDNESDPQTTEVASKVPTEFPFKGGIPNRASGSRETIAKLNLEVVKGPAPKNSPFGLLGVSDHITSYHVGIRGFKPGTTATEMWSWFGGPDGHVKGIIVSHRIRKEDDEIAFVMYGSKALRNTFKGPKHVSDLVWNRFSEKAVIHKVVGNDVCYLTETTLDGKDREVSKAEIRHLRNFRPDGPTKPGLKQQAKDAPNTESSNTTERVPARGLASWKKLFYICLHETPRDISASKVWSWYGGEKGPAEGVILANCKSKNELKGDRFNIAFVGFKDPALVQPEIDKRSSGQRYSPDGTMRFLARLPDSGMIFQSTTSGDDRVLPKLERLHLREQYLTREEILEKANSEGAQGLPPSWKDLELSEEFGNGLHVLQIREPEMLNLTASKAWSWYPPEKYQTRGALVVKTALGYTEFAYVIFTDNMVRNDALNDFSSPTGKAWKTSWAFTVRKCNMILAEEGREVFISTKLGGVDRPITEQEKIYCQKMMKTSAAWNTNIGAKDFITDPEEKAKQEARDAAIEAAAYSDNSDKLFYLNLKRIPPKVTACEVWNWFYGSAGTSKSAVVIYGTNGIAACAYVGFEKETDRDTERPKQKFSKACNFRSYGVRLLSLMTGFKITESTTTGVDRILNDFDLGIIRYKLRKLEGFKQKDEEEARDSNSPDNSQGNGVKTAIPDRQSTRAQVQVKAPEYSSARDQEMFKIPSAPKRRFQEFVTPAEESKKAQGKQPPDQSLQGIEMETITPYIQAPWVPVQTKQSQPQQSGLQENKQNLSTWAPVEQKQQPKPQPANLEAWQKLSYLCLYQTPKGHTASQVWSWFGADKGKAQCVILVHCTSPNKLQDGSFHVSFVGFKEPCILPKELDRLGKSKWYTPEEAMRFLARLPDDCPIFRALTFGHDRLLSKKIRTGLLDYLTEQERVERHYSEQKPEDTPTATSYLQDFTFSEENVHGMLFVQHRVLPKICTACMVWAWHHRDAGKSKGVILLKEADGTPHSAFVAYEDAKARAEALAKGQYTSKASWTCVVRRVSVLADRGFLVSMSTAHGKDRDPTETERAYMLQIRSSNTTPVNSDPMSTDSEPVKVLSTAAAIANAASSQQTVTSAIGIDVAAVAAEDKSDQLFYLRIRKLPENMTACKVWSWFEGASGNSKSAVVVYGANNTTVCAYVGFAKEIDRDLGVTNQKFSKACTYHSRSVFLIDLNPSFKVTESTVAGVDKEFTADDFAVIRYKLQQNAVEKKKQKEGITTPGPSGQQQPNKDGQLTSVHVSDSNGQPNLAETPMEIEKPVEVGKPVQQTQMEVGKPVQQSEMEVDSSAQQPKMDIQQLLESVQNLHEVDSTVYLRLVKLRPNITAGEIWSWFSGSRGPTRSAVLVREGDGTALFAYVGFVSDHTSYLENLDLGTFTVCGPKARNIELASLHPSAMVVQSSKQGDKQVLPDTLYLFRAGIMGGGKTGTGTQPDS